MQLLNLVSRHTAQEWLRTGALQLLLVCSACTAGASSSWLDAETSFRQLAHAGRSLRKDAEEDDWRTTHADMEPLYKSSLEPDIAAWTGRQLNPNNLLKFAAHLALNGGEGYRQDSANARILVVLINKNGVFSSWLYPELAPSGQLHGRWPGVRNILQRLHKSSSSSMVLPDTMFLLNLHHTGICTPRGQVSGVQCGVPVLSYSKLWMGADSQENYEDILYPKAGHGTSEDRVPWEKKSDKAYFQGEIWCTSHHGRIALATLANQTADVDIAVSKWGVSSKLRQLEKLFKGVPRSSSASASSHKYLLSADDCGPDNALEDLMGMGSVVLQIATNRTTYWQRAVKRGEELVYVQPPGPPSLRLTGESVLKYVQSLRKDDKSVQAIAERGEQFAKAYLSPSARALYWQRLLLRYNELWGGEMENVVRGMSVGSDAELAAAVSAANTVYANSLDARRRSAR